MCTEDEVPRSVSEALAMAETALNFLNAARDTIDPAAATGDPRSAMCIMRDTRSTVA